MQYDPIYESSKWFYVNTDRKGLKISVPVHLHHQDVLGFLDHLDDPKKKKTPTTLNYKHFYLLFRVFGSKFLTNDYLRS